MKRNSREPLRSRAHAPRQLTTRENQVIACFAEGLLYKETADKLGISYSAVHKYQHNAFRKLRATNRSEAIRNWWIRTALISVAERLRI